MLFMFVLFTAIFVFLAGFGAMFAFFSVDYIVIPAYKKAAVLLGKIIGAAAFLFVLALAADYYLPEKNHSERLESRNTDAYYSRRSGMTAAHRVEVTTRFREFRVYREMHGADVGTV